MTVPAVFITAAAPPSVGADPTHPTILQTRIVNFALPLTAMIVTAIRLADRTRNRLLWWDDAWAAIAFIFAIIFMTAVELHLEDPSKYTQSVKIAVYYMCAHFFYLVAWTAKLSILFTVIRISPLGYTRRVLILVAFVFGITYAVLFSQVFWVCETQPDWKSEPLPQCFLGRNVAIAQVICDVMSDAILIVAPIRLVYRVRLSRAQKIRLTAIFSTTVLTTIVSMNHAAWVLTAGGLKEALAAVIQTSVSLIVANLSVVVALIFRISTEDTVVHPASLDITSIITFGRAGANPRKKVNGVNVTTTTFMMSDNETRIHTDNIKLDELTSRNPEESTVKFDKLPVVAELTNSDEDQTLVARYKDV